MRGGAYEIQLTEKDGGKPLARIPSVETLVPMQGTVLRYDVYIIGLRQLLSNIKRCKKMSKDNKSNTLFFRYQSGISL